MANNIQIKRSNTNTAPSGLLAGELAWTDNNASAGAGGAAGILYIGDVTTAGAVNRKIGGPGWGLELLTDSALTGTPTAPTVSQSDNSTSIATTAYVDLAVAGATPAMDDVSDVTISGISDADMLVYDNANSLWKNQTMSGHISMDNTGDVSVNNVAANAVALGSQTTGAYIATLTGGDNIVVSGSGGESATATVALDTNVTIAGTLTVNGATTTVDSSTVTVADPIFVIGEAGASDDGKDRGIEFNYHDGTGAKVGFFGWDNSAEAFTFIGNATNNAEVFSGSAGDVAFGNIAGTLTTASQTNITGVGTIGTGVWNGTAVQPLYGGTGGDSSSATGVAVVTGGTWSYEGNLDVGLGGTGVSTVATDGILLGAGAGNMTVLSPGSEGQMMRIVSGSPVWSDALDGGTW